MPRTRAATSDGKERNNYVLSLPEEKGEAVKWVVNRLSKLMADRKLTADNILDVRRAARNDGFQNDELSAAIRFGKMSAERRTRAVDALKGALSLYGFTTEIADEDDTSDRAKLLRSHVQKTISLTRDKADIGAEIRQIYDSAKDYGIDVPSLKQVLKVQKMDPEDRSEWFARLDAMGAFLGYW